MHKISSLWLESPFIHTDSAHALQEGRHLLLILEDEFPRKMFFSCLKVPQKDAQLVRAAACSPGECCSPIFMFHKAEHSTELSQWQFLPAPRRTCSMAAGNAHSGHCLETSAMLATEERAPNKPTNPDCGHGDNAGTQTHPECYRAASAAQQITNNVQCSQFPKVYTRYWPGIAMAQDHPEHFISTVTACSIDHWKNGKCLMALIVLLLLYLIYNNNFSPFFRIKQNTQKLLKTFSSHTNCLPSQITSNLIKH